MVVIALKLATPWPRGRLSRSLNTETLRRAPVAAPSPGGYRSTSADLNEALRAVEEIEAVFSRSARHCPTAIGVAGRKESGMERHLGASGCVPTHKFKMMGPPAKPTIGGALFADEDSER